MALFQDGLINEAQALREYESGILDVAAIEGIDLTAKMSAAQREIGVAIEAILQQERSYASLWAPAAGVSHVAVTEALRHWHAMHSLELFFADAYTMQSNDRYKAKMGEYSRRANQAAQNTLANGIGLVLAPVAKAERPALGSVAGTAAAATYYVRTAGVSSSGALGSPSDIVTAQLQEGRRLTVKAGSLPEGASGWHVYAGVSERALARQNDAPLAPGSTWIMPEASLRPGEAPGNGQTADYLLVPRRRLQRG